MIALEQRINGVLLPVRTQPGAKRNAITGEHDGQLKVSVTQAPEKGKANLAIIDVLANELALKRSQISLIAGETSGQKKFLIAEIEIAELIERVSKILSAQ